MNIEQIATRFTDRPHPEPGDVAIDHPYRAHWWLPIIGPTATCALTHLTADTVSSNWQLTPSTELAVSLGLGRGTATNSPLIRSLERLTRFGFGHFDIAPGESGSDPCLALYRTIGLVPERLTHNWPQPLRHAHAIDLAHMYRQAS